MTSKSAKELLSLILLCLFLLFKCQLPKLQPGDLAPSFALQTLEGRIVYRKARLSSKTPKHPVIFHLYAKRSVFLRALWTNDTSLEAFIEHSPGNTHFVFMSYSDSTEEVLWMRERLHKAIDKYFKRKTPIHGLRTSGSCDPDRNPGNSLSQDSQWRAHEREPFLKLSRVRQRHVDRKFKCHNSQASQWKKRIHFASLSLYEFGNWIPYALMHWPCFGSGCALAQVAIKSKEGEVILVAERLDARYDWLPSPRTLLHKHGSHSRVDFYGNACQFNARWRRKVVKKKKKPKNHLSRSGRIALVAPGGHCTVFTKILHMSKAGVDAVLVYPEEGEPITELTCNDDDCFTPLHIAVSVISHKDGTHLKHLLMERMKLYASYQYTPQENYFLAIDGQGKLAEVGLFLYPSMKFLAYEAKWFNYKTDLVHNLTGSAKIIHVFNHTLMEGETGAVKTISLPSPEDLRLYRNVELDMSLYCPGRSDYSCPHWDHVVHLTVCCDENSVLCGEELGRWITPYRRAVGRWLTNITPLLPLFTSKTCTLRMKHPPWERAWKPSLNIRLSDHVKFSKHHYSGRREDEFNVPYKITKLFHGGKFDKHYNKKYFSLKFKVQPETIQVKLVAIITGHGSDDNGCAEFCVTSHHFLINGVSNIKVFKNAATSIGCANRVADGVVPNEHGTWLYGRDGWCCGKDVVPWVVDVSKQVHFGEENRVRYFGWFNGTDPNPGRDPGEIIMHSYLVFYKSVAL